MGWLNRVINRQDVDLARAVLYEGDEGLAVVGESHYQEALSRAAGGKTRRGVNVEVTVVLRREPRNKYDRNAIGVLVVDPERGSAEPVGHLPADIAARYAPALDRIEAQGHLMALKGHIEGGWDRGGGDEGDFGIWLEHDTADFT